MLRSSSRKPCKACGKIGHTAFNCPYKPRTAIKARTQLKPKKRLKKMGKIGKQLADQRLEFFEEHEPPYLCVYCLVIGYENFLEPEWVNVEHGESKTRHVDRRFDKTNLYVSCQFHNRDKGSMDIDEYIAKLRGQYANQENDESQIPVYG